MIRWDKSTISALGICKRIFLFLQNILFSEVLTLPKERSGFCPQLLGDDLSALAMYCLIRVSFFTWRPWATPESLTMWFTVGPLGHVYQLDFHEWGGGWKPKSATQVSNHIYVTKPQSKLWTPRSVWASLVGNTPHVRSPVTDGGRMSAVHDSTGRGQLGVCAANSPGLCPRRLFSWLILFCILSM